MKRIIGLFAAFAVAVLGLAACESSNDSQAQYGDGSPSSAMSCFTMPDETQRQQLEQYVAANGDSLGQPAGTDSICVLDSQGNARYINQGDGDHDFLMYWAMSQMLFGRGAGSGLLAYGLIDGQIDGGTAVALALLTGFGSDGRAYHPYSYDSGTRAWVQRPNYTQIRVTNVYYNRGTKKASYQDAVSGKVAGLKDKFQAFTPSNKAGTMQGPGKPIDNRKYTSASSYRSSYDKNGKPILKQDKTNSSKSGGSSVYKPSKKTGGGSYRPSSGKRR